MPPRTSETSLHRVHQRACTAPAIMLLVALLASSIAFAVPQAEIPAPEEFFGFPIGTDEKLARWDKILEYFDLLAETSGRVRVDEYGPTTLDNRFVSVVVTAPENFADIDRYVDIGRQLADGRSLSQQQARALAQEGKVTVVLNHNIHSSEIGSSQTSVQLIYEMATSNTPLMDEILDNVIMVLVPSSNPDGQIMVTDWYNQNLGTDFEEAPMPYLYHHYAGHDNNRDFFMGNLVETRYMFKLMFDDWAPQVYLDQHQMGSGGARMFVPPFPDPQSPDIPPLLFQEIRLVGGQIVTDLQAEGKKGILTGEQFRIYGQEGALNWRFHNVVGLLTETASARIASPVTPNSGGRAGRGGRGGGSRGGGSRGGRGGSSEFSVAMVDPWRGGTWTLGDIVDYQMIAARGVLKQTARNREDFLYNQWLMAQETLKRAEVEGPYAWVIPIDQSDPNTAADLVQRLINQGIEVYQAGESFEAIVSTDPLPLPGFVPPDPVEEAAAEEGESEEIEEEEIEEAEEGESEEEPEMEPEPVTYTAGSFIIPGAQRGRPALIDLLEPRAPEIKYQYRDGPVQRRYDSTGYTMSMQMGVDVVRVDTQFDVTTTTISTAVAPMPEVPSQARSGYALDPRINESYVVVNQLLAEGVEVYRSSGPLTIEAGELPAGTFMISRRTPEIADRMQQIASEMRVPVFTDPEGTGNSIPGEIFSARIGLYKPWQASMDEGWTRLTLENHGFSFENIDNARIREGDLGADFDVLIIPQGVQPRTLINGISEERIMEPYAGGVGDEGIETIIEFVEEGGTLLTFERSDQIVFEHFNVPVKDALQGLQQPEFYLPPAVLKLDVNNEHPIGYGMKEKAFAFFGGGRAYEPDGWDAAAGNMRVVATWPSEGRVLASGEMLGDEFLAGRGAVIEVDYDDGKIVMYGFRVQHRAQTQGTFKLFFNALYMTQ